MSDPTTETPLAELQRLGQEMDAMPPTAETPAMDRDAAFLREAARYFRKRPTDGEDRAYWANIYNAENCERIATRLEALNETKD